MATVGTFDVCAGFECTQIVERRAVQTPEGSPVVRARQVNERPLRRWELRWNQDTRRAISRIRYLWALTYGQVLNLTWTPPALSAMEVRFAQPVAYVLESGPATSVVVVLEEVL